MIAYSFPRHALFTLILAGSTASLCGCLDGGGTSGGSGADSASPSTVAAAGATSGPADDSVSSSGSGTTAPVATSPTGTSPSATPQSAGIYLRQPAIRSCDPGQLQTAEKLAVLEALNRARGLHALPPVALDSAADTLVQKSALLGVANGALSHQPPTSWYCYSAEGAQGSSQSNLHIASGFAPVSTSVIASFLIDANVGTLGHRRWLLDPFLGQTAFGRVDGTPFAGGTTSYTAMTLRVMGYPPAPPSGPLPEFVAYPQGNYPANLFRHGWFMSFSVVADRQRAGGNGSAAIDFSGASVQVSDSTGLQLGVTERSYNYQGYGLPNHLQWKVAGTRDRVDYAVRVTGVRVNGAMRTFDYNFRIE